MIRELIKKVLGLGGPRDDHHHPAHGRPHSHGPGHRHSHDHDHHHHGHDHHHHGHDHGHDHDHAHGHDHGHSHARGGSVITGIQIGRKPGTGPREGLPPRTGDVETYIKEAIDHNPVLIFVKGVPSAPACGFSARVLDLFNRTGVPYQTVNVLEDPEVREGIKRHTNWPTIPQVFINGEFIGGCDIVTDMFSSGELQKVLEAVQPRPQA